VPPNLPCRFLAQPLRIARPMLRSRVRAFGPTRAAPLSHPCGIAQLWRGTLRNMTRQGNIIPLLAPVVAWSSLLADLASLAHPIHSRTGRFPVHHVAKRYEVGPETSPAVQQGTKRRDHASRRSIRNHGWRAKNKGGEKLKARSSKSLS